MLLSIREFWNQAMAIREARWVIAAAGLLVSLLVGFYIFKLVRDMALGNTSFGPVDSSEFLTDFQKLRNEGKLNDEEYARLKQAIPTAHSGREDSSSPEESSSGTEANFSPPSESD